MTNLLKMLPHSLKSDPFIVACTEAFEIQMLQLRNEFDNVSNLVDISTTNEQLIDYLAFEKMIEFYFDLTIGEKQEFIRNVKELKVRKGTLHALEKVLEILGFSGVVSEWFEYAGEPGYFSVAVDLSLRGTSAESLALLSRLIDEYKRKSAWLEMLYTFLTTSSEMHIGVCTQISKTIEIY